MCYTCYILNIKETIIKIDLSIVLYLRQNHSAKTIEVSGIIFEYCAQYFSDTSERCQFGKGYGYPKMNTFNSMTTYKYYMFTTFKKQKNC